MRQLAIRLIRPHISLVRDTVKLQAVADLERGRASCGGCWSPHRTRGAAQLPLFISKPPYDLRLAQSSASLAGTQSVKCADINLAVIRSCFDRCLKMLIGPRRVLVDEGDVFAFIFERYPVSDRCFDQPKLFESQPMFREYFKNVAALNMHHRGAGDEMISDNAVYFAYLDTARLVCLQKGKPIFCKHCQSQ